MHTAGSGYTRPGNLQEELPINRLSPHDDLLARAGSGLLSRSLIYAAHHRPRRATLTRLRLAERLSFEAPSLRQLVAVLSVGLEALLTAVVCRLLVRCSGCLVVFESGHVSPLFVEELKLQAPAATHVMKRVCGW
jgi:hypothetical protein